MGLVAGNPVVGGTVLQRAAIQSPNFLTGVTGWSIKQDGSAEFNNVTVRGADIVDGVQLFYNGTPAAGNLIASVASVAGTDSFLNAYLEGQVSYSPGSPALAVQNAGGVITWWTAGSEAGPWTQQALANFVTATSDLLIKTAGTLQLTSTGGGQVSVESTFHVGGTLWLLPSGDITGVTDTAALNTALTVGSVVLLPGQWFFDAPVTLPPATSLRGSGWGITVCNMVAGFTGSHLFGLTGEYCQISDLSIFGASATTALNPVADAILIDNTSHFVTHIRVDRIIFQAINGWAVHFPDSGLFGAPDNNVFADLRGYANGGMGIVSTPRTLGIKGYNIGITADSGAAILDGILLQDLFDFDFVTTTSGTTAASTGHAIHLVGHVANGRFLGGEIGGAPPAVNSGACGVKIEDDIHGHASDVDFIGMQIQTADVGVNLGGSCASIRFSSCDISANNLDGVDVTSTGINLLFRDCSFGRTSNGQGAPTLPGTYFDLNWNTTGHGQAADCTFGSAIVANGSIGVQFSFNANARNRDVELPNVRFNGTGAAPANWWSTPAAIPRYAQVIGATPGLTLRQPAIAATGVAVTNDTGFDCAVYIVPNTLTVITLGGTALTGLPTAVHVPANSTIALTYTGAAPTWQWFAN